MVSGISGLRMVLEAKNEVKGIYCDKDVRDYGKPVMKEASSNNRIEIATRRRRPRRTVSYLTVAVSKGYR